MKKFYQVTILGVALFAASCDSNANLQTNQSPENHDSHLMKVNEDGDKAMGFSHEKTTHHFRLFRSGGAIEVTANDAGDAESRDQIRKHLSHIAQMFAAGNFDAPMLTHGKTPPGVPLMQKMKEEISYKYEEIERGGRVGISTDNKEALPAIYEYLRFQITDHQTGDSIEVMPE
ncbi:MAG TPA: hypothetical protein VNI84_04815 [Pyrinomonadaceae bacterium]|nr:hypothetical protein [Pyrinomonadaceae bacterium]